jgi:hypothetical protein
MEELAILTASANNAKICLQMKKLNNFWLISKIMMGVFGFFLLGRV